LIIEALDAARGDVVLVPETVSMRRLEGHDRFRLESCQSRERCHRDTLDRSAKAKLNRLVA
jgi:hypothetical protein